MKSKIILLVGPTGCGKTHISIEIAKFLNAEIINADSRYIYKEPLIATAKITKEEMNGIKHHMIDVASLEEDYSIFDYQTEGRKILDKLIKDNKNVIIVGGSGLYIKSLLFDYKLPIKKDVNIDLSNLSNLELKTKLDLIYKNNDIHINNRQRMERYLIHYYETGELIETKEDKDIKLYDFTTIYLFPDRDTLYNRINKRVDYMFDNGLLNEAKELSNLKHFKDIIGYRELIPFFNNECTLEEAKNMIKQNSRRYAKRQYTWFNNQMKDSLKIDINYNNIDDTINYIKTII